MKKTIAAFYYKEFSNEIGWFDVIEAESKHEVGAIVSLINPAPEGKEPVDDYIERDLVSSFSFPRRHNLAWMYPDGKVESCGFYVVVPPELAAFARSMKEKLCGLDQAPSSDLTLVCLSLEEAIKSVEDLKGPPYERCRHGLRGLSQANELIRSSFEAIQQQLLDEGLSIKVRCNIPPYFDIYGKEWAVQGKIEIEGPLGEEPKKEETT